MRVLIVGAGPTGLTAGVELARLGIQAQIIERRENSSTLSRAVGISSISMSLLEPSGVTAKLIEHGIKYQCVNIYQDSRRLLSLPFSRAKKQNAYDFLLGLPQDQTESILHETFFSLVVKLVMALS